MAPGRGPNARSYARNGIPREGESLGIEGCRLPGPNLEVKVLKTNWIFRDRADAGKQLAEHVLQCIRASHALVLALPRGGVPVGFEVARALQADLDVFLVRKLGLPGQEELAIGAIASGGVRVLNELLVAELALSPKLVDQITATQQKELIRREELYREGRPARSITGRTVILVDDGLATGATMKAAVQAVRLQGPKHVVVAVPVAAKEICDEFRTIADDIICAYTPPSFASVGTWYQDFSQTSDDEVQRLLLTSASRQA
jgi:putative phosphoribosyl transferase